LKKTLNKWNRRQLTPLGRITVLKSLVLSQLTYLFLNLPDPPTNVLKELEHMFFQFLWNKKPAKIKKSVICKLYIEGGLQMIDVGVYIASLKSSWLRRISSECNLQTLIFNLFPNFKNLNQLGGEYVHYCMQHCNNPFWFDVLRHFKHLYTKCCPENLSEFLGECIHYNVNILRDRKVVFVKEWIRNEILYVHQLFNPNERRFYTFDEFEEQYPEIERTNFLLYSGVVHAIQQYLNNCDIAIMEDYCTVNTKVWVVIAKGSDAIKRIFLKNDTIPTAVSRWNDFFEELDWNEIFLRCFKFADIKLKWFQARLVHRLLPTRKYLYDCKLAEDPLCSFCNENVQTIQHLFWQCEIVQTFWSFFERHLYDNCSHCNTLKLTEKLVLFGCNNNVVTDFGFDYILVVAKFFIYKCYMSGSLPNLQAFLAVLKRRHSELEYLAYVTGSYPDFTRCWSHYQSFLHFGT